MLGNANLVSAIIRAQCGALADRAFGRSARRQLLRQKREYYTDFWTRVAQRGGGSLDEIGDGFLRVNLGDRKTMVRGSFVGLDNMVTLKFAKNKNLAEELLVQEGLPLTRGTSLGLGNWREGIHLLQKHPAGLVVKPADGSGGKGVTTCIKRESDFTRALSVAWIYSRKVRVEPFATGASYRLLFIRGELIDTIRRDSPTLIGDGRSTIGKLVDLENARRMEQRPIVALTRLALDLDACVALADQGHSKGSVPARDDSIRVKNAVNQNNRNENSRVSEVVHASYRAVGKSVFEITGISFLGLDVITTSISEDYRSSGGVINEVNTTPALHHHDLIGNGDGVDIGLQVIREAIEVDGRWSNRGTPQRYEVNSQPAATTTRL